MIEFFGHVLNMSLVIVVVVHHVAVSHVTDMKIDEGTMVDDITMIDVALTRYVFEIQSRSQDLK